MRSWPRRRRFALVMGAALVCIVVFLRLSFPGRRLGLALTIATGFRRAQLQARIDEIEAQAIRRAPFSEGDKEFLNDFYRTLATGAKLSVLVRQTGNMMDHYLDGSGADYRLDPSIFRENRKVQAQLALLRKQASAAACEPGKQLSSPTFYMPDESKIDSVFGLYHGRVRLSGVEVEPGRCAWRFRAEVPWSWPSYESLRRKYGTPHAESFPLPNLATLAFGREHALFVDNGLGEYLVQLGLAQPFLAFAEWEE